MRATLGLPLVLLSLSLQAQTSVMLSQGLQTRFAQAYAAYQAGRLPEAGTELRELAREKPDNFDVHELLGLVYSAQKRGREAAVELRKAVALQGRSASAHNNLATTLMSLGETAGAETEWRAALSAQPDDYSANRNLGSLYLQQGRTAEALPPLKAAQRLHPEASENSYSLAFAQLTTDQLNDARTTVEAALTRKDAAEFHALLGQISEKQGRYVEAANQLSVAAHQDPSEENLFAWASELMMHRAYQPAITVFSEGTRRYPRSARMWVGQGMALYSRGDYEPAIAALVQATDLDVGDARSYLYLSKAYLSSPSQAEAVIQRFQRYATLKPNDALAQYYYAISLWKGRRVNDPQVDYPAVERLFARSIALNGEDAQVRLQRGILLNDEHKYAEAQEDFERAVKLDPALADAHFRLGRAYLKAGERDKAQAELDQFKTLQAAHQAALDRQRAEVQQFVIATQDSAQHATP